MIFLAGSCCKTAGWGVTGRNLTYVSEKSTLADELQEIGLPVIDLEACSKNYAKRYKTPKVTNDTFCAGLYGIDSCAVGILNSDIFLAFHY